MPRPLPSVPLLFVLLALPGCDILTGPTIPGVRETWSPGTIRTLQGVVRVDTLTIRAGTTVCGEPGAFLFVPDRLEVRGTAARPVVFTACDPAEGWGGLAVNPEFGASGSGRLEHVLIEHADVGIEGFNLMIFDARFRQIRGPAIVGGARITNTTIDTACTAGSCAAVAARAHSPIELHNVAIRGSGGGGISRGRRAPVLLRDVIIEGSAGVAIDLGYHLLHNDMANFTVEGDLRLTDNLYPAILATHDVPQLLPTPESYDRILGNQHDTLIVGIISSPEALTVRAVLPWRVQDGGATALGYLRMPGTIEPGATIAGGTGLEGPVHLIVPAGTTLEGTGAGPITFRDLELNIQGDALDTTHVRHVRLDSGAVLTTRQRFGTTPGPVALEDAWADGARIDLTSDGSRIERVVARGGVADTLPTVWLSGAGAVARDVEVREAPGPGIVLGADDILLDRCRVSGGLTDGVLVLGGAGIRIRACNLEANVGAAVANAGTDTVDATENWWGDPDGPLGPAGDGVSGPVEFTPWLTAPAGSPSSPARP